MPKIQEKDPRILIKHAKRGGLAFIRTTKDQTNSYQVMGMF